MKKRLAAIIMSVAMALAAFAACLGLAACSTSLEDPGTEPAEGTLTILDIRTVGEYSGYEVHYVRLCYSGVDVNTVVKRIVIDDVYIASVGDPSYNYIIFLNDSGDEDSYITLQQAYDQGLVTHDDLKAIAAAEQENGAYTESRVASLEEIRDVGEYSGYEVYFGRIGLYDKSYNGGRAVDITIDGVYICTVPDDMYDYYLYEDEELVLLSEAFTYNLISHDDLESLAEAEAEYLTANADTAVGQYLAEPDQL